MRFPNLERKDAVTMKLYVWKAPAILSPILRKLFAGKGKKRVSERTKSTYLK